MQNWEEIPGIDKAGARLGLADERGAPFSGVPLWPFVSSFFGEHFFCWGGGAGEHVEVVKRAESLELKQPLRNLGDLFYASQPEELPWIRTECVIDVVQAAAYLGQAVVFLYKAIEYDGLECPDNTPVGCAVSVAGFITSITWIASYLSFAANACGAAVNSGALCAGDWTALMANFGEMATVGAAVKDDCDFSTDWGAILNLTDSSGPPPPIWQQFVPAGAAPTVETYQKVKALREQNTNRNMDITQCVMDVTNSASYVVRAILQIRSAASACPDPKACAINIMSLGGSQPYTQTFLAFLEFTRLHDSHDASH